MRRPPDGASSSSGHEDNGWISGVCVGVEDVEDKTASTVRCVHRSSDEHTYQIQPLLILKVIQTQRSVTMFETAGLKPP